MEYDTTLEIDEPVIVRLDQFYKGNLSTDFEEGNFAYCRFGTYFHPVDISEYSKIDFLALMGIYEDEFSTDLGESIELFDTENFLSIAEDIINKIEDNKVKRYCNRYLGELKKEPEFDIIIELLNQILIISEYAPDELPEVEEIKIDKSQQTRGLFRIGSERSNKKDPIFRFTLPPKILEDYLKDNSDFTIRATLIWGNSSIRFQVLDGVYDENMKFSDSREMVLNSGCYKVKFPRDLYKKLIRPDNDLQLYLRRQGKTILFDLCE